LNLSEIPRGSRVFVDGSIFLHHFAGASLQCRTLLERCERSEIRGATSALVVAEVTERLMCLEAVAKGLLSPGQVARKLRARPELAQKLQIHEEVTAQIPLMGVEVLPLDLRGLLAAAALRRHVGLPAGASFVAASAREAGIDAVATSEADLDRVDGLRLYKPADL
jgi:predicted nucleic acid-binding protein